MLGQARSLEQARALVLAYRDSHGGGGRARADAKAWWDDRLGTIQVHTPELAADFLVNRWLLYQTLSCRVWGRSGFYQSGGAFGFRDQLQDVMALLYAHPVLARAAHPARGQPSVHRGRCPALVAPAERRGIRSRISDDLLWLPYVVAHYVRITGDVSILRETGPFPRRARAGKRSARELPVSGDLIGAATLFEHCRRAVTARPDVRASMACR